MKMAMQAHERRGAGPAGAAAAGMTAVGGMAA